MTVCSFIHHHGCMINDLQLNHHQRCMVNTISGQHNKCMIHKKCMISKTAVDSSPEVVNLTSDLVGVQDEHSRRTQYIRRRRSISIEITLEKYVHRTHIRQASQTLVKAEV